MRSKHLFPVILLIAGTFACAPVAQPTTGIPVPIAPAHEAATTPRPPASVTPATSATNEFVALLDTANSGSVCADGTVANGGPPPTIGEKNDAYDCEGVWTFGIQGVPSSSTIVSAVFSPENCAENGDPSELSFELVDYGNLDASDYGNGAVGSFQDGALTHIVSSCTIAPIEITDHVQAQLQNGVKAIQVRGYILNGAYGNAVEDSVSFSQTTPKLIIRYR